MDEEHKQRKRIREKAQKYAYEKGLSFSVGWKILYKEFQDRTGVNPYKGMRPPMDNIMNQHLLDDFEIMVDELVVDAYSAEVVTC